MSFYDENLTLYVTRESNLDWETADAAKQGFDSKLLIDATSNLSSESHSRPPSASFLVIRGEHLVWERYFDSSPNEANNVHSVSKTILSALVGIALEKGDLECLRDPIKRYLSGYHFKQGNNKITVEDLLTMRSGLEWQEDYTEYDVEDESSWVQDILNRTKDDSSGEMGKIKKIYSTGDTHLLGAVLASAVNNESLESYAQEHLFSPLGIRPTRWTLDPENYNSGGFNFYMSPRELAKLARLFLQKGCWNKEQIVPESWIDRSWKAAEDDDGDATEDDPHGFLWYHMKYPNRRVFYMEGFGGQYVYVLPDDNVAVVHTSDTYGWVDPDQLDGNRFMEEFVFPALPERNTS